MIATLFLASNSSQCLLALSQDAESNVIWHWKTPDPDPTAQSLLTDATGEDRLILTVPGFALPKAYKFLEKEDVVRVEISMFAERQKETADHGLIEVWWSEPKGTAILLILEGGSGPKELSGHGLTRTTALLIDQKKVLAKLQVQRKEGRTIVDIPGHLLPAQKPWCLLAKWLPAKVTDHYAPAGLSSSEPIVHANESLGSLMWGAPNLEMFFDKYWQK